MKKTITIAAMLIVSLAASAQTKPTPKPKQAPEKQYTIQLNETELQQLFALVSLAKNLAPYGKQKPEDKINTIQFIDEYSEKLSGRIIEAAPADTVKKK